MTKRSWIKLLAQNRGIIFGLAKEAYGLWRGSRKVKQGSTGEESSEQRRAA
jgi:hypothetical protein